MEEALHDSDPAYEAARDVARLFNKPGLRHLARLARAAEAPLSRTPVERAAGSAGRPLRTS